VTRFDRWMLLLTVGTFAGAYPLMYFAQEYISLAAAILASAAIALAIIAVRAVTLMGWRLDLAGVVLPGGVILALTLTAAVVPRLQGILLTAEALGFFIVAMLLFPKIRIATAITGPPGLSLRADRLLLPRAQPGYRSLKLIGPVFIRRVRNRLILENQLLVGRIRREPLPHRIHEAIPLVGRWIQCHRQHIKFTKPIRSRISSLLLPAPCLSGGSIPPNILEPEPPTDLLKFGNNAANDLYTERCKDAGQKIHPARFPAALPEFFIKLLTDEGDIVLDPFAGSNTTGAVAERLERRWIAVERVEEYLRASRFRFD
jgi:hypothetical protein